MIGLARVLVLNPELVNDWLSSTGDEPDFPRFETPPQGGVTAWYTMFLTAIGHDNESNFTLDLASAIRSYEERDQARGVKWQAKFQ